MTVLTIFKLESDDNPVSTLNIGEHIFGRGQLLQCEDRRVSRKHGVITVSEETATITSTHQNPCFYQSANSSTITILPKDSPVNINDGDKFALLADQFWFRIKIVQVYNCIENNTEHLNSVNDNSLSDADKKGLHSPGPQTSNHDSNGEVQVNNGDSDSSVDLLQTPQKRKLDNDEEESNVKKIKPDETIANEEEHNKPSESVVQKETMSESEDEDNKTNVTKQVTPKRASKASKKKAESSSTVQTSRDDELKSMLFSSDEEDGNDVKAAVNTNVAEEQPTSVGKCAVDETNKIKEEGKNDSSSDTKEAKDDPDKPGTSNSRQRRRDRCWYGLSCYRKSAKHSEDFTHPGDSDFESDPNDSRPMCVYGDACYRRNKTHRETYKHNRPPQKAPGHNKKAKKNKGPPKKRTTKKKYYDDETSEDEYDMEDPFMADSGSEYEADSGSDFSDDDSDSNWSGTEEETKRLLKEAKRFTKGKKKDKDDD